MEFGIQLQGQDSNRRHKSKTYLTGTGEEKSLEMKSYHRYLWSKINKEIHSGDLMISKLNLFTQGEDARFQHARDRRWTLVQGMSNKLWLASAAVLDNDEILDFRNPTSRQNQSTHPHGLVRAATRPCPSPHQSGPHRVSAATAAKFPHRATNFWTSTIGAPCLWSRRFISTERLKHLYRKSYQWTEVGFGNGKVEDGDYLRIA